MLCISQAVCEGGRYSLQASDHWMAWKIFESLILALMLVKPKLPGALTCSPKGLGGGRQCLLLTR